MKIIVTHTSPDWDAIGSVWLLKRYLPGWNDAAVKFVPAGLRLEKSILTGDSGVGDPVEKVGKDEVIHVDTGLGPLDHHQTSDKTISGAGLVWRFILEQIDLGTIPIAENEKWQDRKAALGRIVQFIIDTDHFKEVFWTEPAADYHEFTILGLLEGLKLLKPEQDDYYVELGREVLDAMLHTFENRVWAEREIKENGKEFVTRYGKALAFETLNDTVLKLAQKMGYVLVVRKDPRKGYVRIKARPTDERQSAASNAAGTFDGAAKRLAQSEGAVIVRNGMTKQSYEIATPSPLSSKRTPSLSLSPLARNDQDIDLTTAYEKLKAIDPQATWFLHASKKMLLNGTPKNPKMIPTRLTLSEIVKVLESI